MDPEWTVEVVESDGDLVIVEKLGEVEIGTTTGLVPSSERIYGVGSLDERWLVFTVAEAVEAVEVRLSGGEVERPQLTKVPGVSAKFFAMERRGGADPLLVVALTASGDELAQRDLRRRTAEPRASLQQTDPGAARRRE